MYVPDSLHKLFSASSQNICTPWFRLELAPLIYPTDVLEQTVRNAIASADAVHNGSLKTHEILINSLTRTHVGTDMLEIGFC